MAHKTFTGLLTALCCCLTVANADQSDVSKLDVAVLDQSHLTVPSALVEIKIQGQVIAAMSTNETGHALFSAVKPGHYTVSASKEGFETASTENFDWKQGVAESLELTLKAATSRQTIEVVDTTSPIEASSAPSVIVTGKTVRELPSRPATVNDALPLIPGIARQPDGKLQLSGSGEHRSAMIVNSADVTDPATGEFGLTVPIDIVDNLNFYQTSYLAEYGRFSAGLVSVETRRGGETWKWELNDPLPEFNIRSWGLRGLRTATPRLNVDGPLIPGKLFFSEGFEYVERKTPVFTLPFPFNQKKNQGFNSFAQLDWVTSDKNLITATIHVAPQRLGFVNLDYYNPEPTTPDARTHNYTATISDKWFIFGGVWENTISATKFDATIWPKGSRDFVIQPQMDSGNYFASQNRDAERYSWSSSFAFGQWKHWGEHNYKSGIYVAKSDDRGRISEHPIDIEDATGHLLERTAFTSVGSYNKSDTELAFYGQDHWILNPRLSLDLGLRTEFQEISGTSRLAPRAGLAWNPFKRLGTVVRAGVGVFYDRIPLGVYSFNQYPERVVTLYDGNGLVTSGPFTYINGLGEVKSHRNFIFSRETPGNFSPRSTTSSLQVEQPITRDLRLRIGYLNAISSDLVILEFYSPQSRHGHRVYASVRRRQSALPSV